MENAPGKNTRGIAAWEVAVLLLCLGFLAAHSIYAARVNSVTADEYVHLPVSIAILQTGDLHMDHKGSPPMRALAAVPALAQHPVTDYTSGFWKSGAIYGFSWQFMVDNLEKYHELFFGPRLAVAGFAVLLGLFVFAAARAIIGPAGAAFAFLLYCFNPEILAHAPLMTVDVMVACFFFAAFYFFIRFTRAPGVLNTLGMGLCTGLAMLAKFSALALPPVLLAALLLFFFSRGYRKSRVRWHAYAAAFAIAMIVAIITLNAGYGFQGAGERLADFQWHSEGLKTLARSWIGKLPMPLPHLYADALNVQAFNQERGAFTYYLNGALSTRGWASYYWYALVLKTPVALLLACAGGVLWSLRRGGGFAGRVLWVVPAAFMLAATFAVRIDMGFRYLLPMIPFLIVIAAGALAWIAGRSKSGASVAAVLCAWYALSAMVAFGNQLSYFNELAGGPDGGYRYLVESNLDWGQNLVRLKTYVNEDNAEPLLLYNYGLNTSAAYGIKAGWVPCKPARAVVAISVNYLVGVDPFEKRPKECFDWLGKYEPVEKIGGGLFVFDTR